MHGLYQYKIKGNKATYSIRNSGGSTFLTRREDKIDPSGNKIGKFMKRLYSKRNRSNFKQRGKHFGNLIE